MAKDILTRSAEEVYKGGKLRYGGSQVVVSEQGIIEIDGESLDDIKKILSLLKGKVEVKEV